MNNIWICIRRVSRWLFSLKGNNFIYYNILKVFSHICCWMVLDHSLTSSKRIPQRKGTAISRQCSSLILRSLQLLRVQMPFQSWILDPKKQRDTWMWWFNGCWSNTLHPSITEDDPPQNPGWKLILPFHAGLIQRKFRKYFEAFLVFLGGSEETKIHPRPSLLCC